MREFSPLPRPVDAKGQPRKTGVEIELGGLGEAEVAQICAKDLGGEVCQIDSHIWRVMGSRIGKIEVYLDTFLRSAAKSKLRDLALDLGREVVPVEIVTEPLDRDGLQRLDGLRDSLRKAGALGSGAGIVFGFGVHLNVQIASYRDADIVRPLLAYALIEDWMRSANPIDESRRLLPFTDPYPTEFVRDLIALSPDAPVSEVMESYLHHNPTRNRGLDMLTIFAELAPDRVAAAVSGKVSARPTFHFRLPDCLIDDAGWSLVDEWQRWLVVERVAQDAALLDQLGRAWEKDHGVVTISRQSWARRCGEILQAAGVDTSGA
ncbi:amidoligase family protein [uncultured Roseovarius sp.]|uniref:amidoligase family protein n=1 Tax=uncultured Roseovarius sp. TaxID=293344 RepID=UPI0025F88F2F|nr:amidoligase family protein [uncultured Roseovarius sp.]